MKKNNPLKDKSFEFALDVINLFAILQKEKKEFVMSKQLLRSGTAIGALYREAEYAESKADFIHKLSIVQKECNETLYWIELLFHSDLINRLQHESLYYKAEELMKLLTSIIKSSKLNRINN